MKIKKLPLKMIQKYVVNRLHYLLFSCFVARSQDSFIQDSILTQDSKNFLIPFSFLFLSTNSKWALLANEPQFFLALFLQFMMKQKGLFRESPSLRKWILVAYKFCRCQLEHETKLLRNTEVNVLS